MLKKKKKKTSHSQIVINVIYLMNVLQTTINFNHEFMTIDCSWKKSIHAYILN